MRKPIRTFTSGSGSRARLAEPQEEMLELAPRPVAGLLDPGPEVEYLRLADCPPVLRGGYGALQVGDRCAAW